MATADGVRKKGSMVGETAVPTSLWRVRVLCLVAAVALGALYAWVGRYAMNADGLSYLDMADAYRRGDWQMAVSTVWSPLYAWILALSLAGLAAGPPHEFQVVQLTNFVIYLGALAAFDFFVRAVLDLRARSSARGSRAVVPDAALLATGYMLFVWSALNLIRITLVTPHLLVAALVLCATGLLLRIALRPDAWRLYGAMGAVLGLAYLARTPMALLAVVFFGLAALPWTHVREVAPRLLVAAAAFALIAASYAVPLYVVKRRAPFGDFARVNYAIWVNGYPLQHWQGEPAGSGSPRHPTRRLLAKPAVYEFAEPIGGTYPVWYDPAYWFEGVTPHFDAAGHVRAFWRSVRISAVQDVLSHWVPSLIVWLLVAAYARARGWLTWAGVARYGGLYAIPVTAIAAFLPVQLIDRYIGGFMPILWVGLLASVAAPPGQGSTRAVLRLALVVLVVHAVLIVPSTAKRTLETTRDLAGAGDPAASHVQWEVAESLRHMGVRPGAHVAVLGSAFNAYWARLARAKVVAEIPVDAAADFWAADDQGRERAIRALATTSAEIVVLSPRVRPSTTQAIEILAAMGWQRVGATDYYALALRR